MDKIDAGLRGKGETRCAQMDWLNALNADWTLLTHYYGKRKRMGKESRERKAERCKCSSAVQ